MPTTDARHEQDDKDAPTTRAEPAASPPVGPEQPSPEADGPAPSHASNAARKPPPSEKAARRNVRLWREQRINRWSLLWNKPRVRAARALVLMTRTGELVPYTLPRQPTYGQLLASPAGTMYEVDTGRHQTIMRTTLPSRVDAFAFTADLTLVWRVVRPVEAVLSNIHNLGPAMARSVAHELRSFSRRYPIDATAEAERELNEHLQHRSAKALLFLESEALVDAVAENEHLAGVGYGTHVTAFLHLWTDDEGVQHASVSRRIELEREWQKLRHLKEQNHRQIVAARVEYYRGIIDQGDMNRFALQLAKNPADSQAILDAIRAHALTNRKQTIDFVSRLVESGAISAYQIEEQVRVALEWLKTGTDRVLGHPIQTEDNPIPQRRRVQSTVDAELPLPEEPPAVED
ncbi:hypothetical protein [Actinoplanes sp. NBRC 101535]|uniref:hypothetical protein n=1 Tax=Actinoplanes sp. NBRC 101535 TaxID=3032196 RepID=UPI0024A56B3A|nr:hypothetical protein [Actinoplanes sp. NBRC 101535]GLY05514.1 hypothetical protein Acsp01_58930 [Actinoplanes sp. NBRC 101535]